MHVILTVVPFAYFCFLSVFNQYYLDLIPRATQEE